MFSKLSLILSQGLGEHLLTSRADACGRTPAPTAQSSAAYTAAWSTAAHAPAAPGWPADPRLLPADACQTHAAACADAHPPTSRAEPQCASQCAPRCASSAAPRPLLPSPRSCRFTNNAGVSARLPLLAAARRAERSARYARSACAAASPSGTYRCFCPLPRTRIASLAQ